jgi:hypothetical protein
MHNQQTTIELLEVILRQLTLRTEATHRLVEILVSQSVPSHRPPAIDMAPLELQPEFLMMQTLGITELKAIAQAPVESGQHDRHVELRRKHEEGQLRKAYAWSLLRWRGHIPSLEELRRSA